MKFSRPLLDYKGYRLCDMCWNGKHWHNEIITGKDGCPKKTARLIEDCLGEPCECPCRILREERKTRKMAVKPDPTLQLDIDMTNPIQIGNPHKNK